MTVCQIFIINSATTQPPASPLLVTAHGHSMPAEFNTYPRWIGTANAAMFTALYISGVNEILYILQLVQCTAIFTGRTLQY
jgi:hypothetical protein